jgi:iron complex transport system permease protein
LSITCLALFLLDLALGSVRIPLGELPGALFGSGDNPTWTAILTIFRLPKALTALASGAALAVSGLVLQTLFRNPLAGPDSLGIGAGASVGAGIVMLLAGGSGSAFLGELGLAGYSVLAIAAALGAGLVLALILFLSRRIASSLTLLIVGVLVGYFAGSLLSLLVFFASPEKVQVYLGWTYGSFGGVTRDRLPVLIFFILFGLALLFRRTKALDAILLGDRVAESIGIDTRKTRRLVLVSASLLAGAVTAFCGPIAFLGIAAPQGARRFFRSSSHRVLLPASALMGSFFALLADCIAQAGARGVLLPLNPLLALLGAPLILGIFLGSPRKEVAS